ncbi:MAG: hypothetical protein SNF68_08540 [Rikenellaceae bacterium]
MKSLKHKIALLSCILLSQGVMAQVNSVQLNLDGTKAYFGVLIEGLGEVIIDTYGNIERVIIGDDDDDRDVKYEYYSNFNSYEAGKIKSIGAVSFTYYSNFNKYEAGKVKTVAGTNFIYYSDFNDYEAGKIKSVAGVRVNYYSNFNDYEAGKIKSIGDHKYEYFSGFGGSNNAGQPKSGYAKIKVNGIAFRVTNRH